ncbi:kinase-like domain-containing protein [Dactylonectria estremocensis]|uniref:Kinase-like domain-containing protein n=1 Tax=Dactylonectria estremocensis TaxID=1079267 RepID=A0A9P9EH13_9HYPO|nr:kinase-like domain-containing protein [Dactylonectria estremocensis]
MAASTTAVSHEVRGVMKSSDPLPLTVEGLTATWFTKILGKPVKDATVVEAIHGTASKILIALTFEDSADAPTRVCVKGGFNPSLTSIPFMLSVYRLEAEFYYYIAPTIKMPLPPTIYSGTDAVTGQGIIVLADLKAQGYTFGNPLEPWSVDRVRAGVEQLATLHASTWGSKPEDFPWASETVSLRDAVLGLVSPGEWDKRFAGDAKPPVPEYMVDRERITATFQALWKPSNSRLNCLVHGDAHIGNTFISPAGEPGFLDWQVIHTGSAMHDVAYFIIGSLTIEERRNHEKELLKHYLDALHRGGAPKLQLDEVWDEYRKHAFHGFAWSLAGPMMQSREIVDVMTERHCAAIVDHKSIELLEGLEE